VALCVLILLLLLAAPAAAGTVAVEGDAVAYTAEPGERNQLIVTTRDGEHRFRDNESRLGAGPGCRAEGEREAVCPAGRLTLQLGDLDDTLDLMQPPGGLDGGPGKDFVSFGGAPQGVQVDLRSPVYVSVEDVFGSAHGDVLIGGAEANSLSGHNGDDRIESGGGDDVLSAGLGRDLLSAGDGNDRVDTQSDVTRDQTDCGAGADTAMVERGDRHSGCEQVTEHGPFAPRMALVAQVGRPGVYRLTYECAPIAVRCTGLTRLRLGRLRLPAVRFGPPGPDLLEATSKAFRIRKTRRVTLVTTTILDPGEGAGALPAEQWIRLPKQAQKPAAGR
jgi:hypothetical protein